LHDLRPVEIRHFARGFARFADEPWILSTIEWMPKQFVRVREIRVSKSKTAGLNEEPGRCELSHSAL